MPAVSKIVRPDNKSVFALDDGTKEITLVNPFGKVIARLHIRTADISILDRYNALMKDFSSITKPLADISLNADGTVEFDKDWAKMKKVEGQLIQKINALFDMDDANELFATRNPFSSVGGKFFVERVLETLGQVVGQAVEEEAKLSAARTAKYLDDLNEEENDDRISSNNA